MGKQMFEQNVFGCKYNILAFTLLRLKSSVKIFYLSTSVVESQITLFILFKMLCSREATE